MPIREDVWPEGTPCWVDCQVDDPADAAGFYRALFGWEIAHTPDGASGYLVALKDDEAVGGIGPKLADSDQPSAWLTYLATDSADVTAAKITAAGGRLLVEPVDIGDPGRMAVAADPTGAVFALWEAKARTGATIFNEDGSFCWNELHTTDYVAAQEFYAAVFGFSYDEIGDGETFTYSLVKRRGGEGVGGINDATKVPGDVPSYWVTWFQSDDTDTAVARVTELGGGVRRAPADTAFGRSAVVTGKQGEVFGLINPSA